MATSPCHNPGCEYSYSGRGCRLKVLFILAAVPIMVHDRQANSKHHHRGGGYSLILDISNRVQELNAHVEVCRPQREEHTETHTSRCSQTQTITLTDTQTHIQTMRHTQDTYTVTQRDTHRYARTRTCARFISLCIVARIVFRSSVSMSRSAGHDDRASGVKSSCGFSCSYSASSVEGARRPQRVYCAVHRLICMATLALEVARVLNVSQCWSPCMSMSLCVLHGFTAPSTGRVAWPQSYCCGSWL